MRQHCLLSSMLSHTAFQTTTSWDFNRAAVRSWNFKAPLETAGSTLVSCSIYLLWITEPSSTGESIQLRFPSRRASQTKKRVCSPSAQEQIVGTLLRQGAAGQLLPFLTPLHAQLRHYQAPCSHWKIKKPPNRVAKSCHFLSGDLYQRRERENTHVPNLLLF